MQVNRNGNRFFQGTDQFKSRLRFQQARHVLNPQYMGTGILNILRQLGVVLEIVFGLGRIQDIACITKRSFRQTLGLGAHVFNTRSNGLHPVQGIKNAEDIQACFPGLSDKLFNQVVRIGLIPHSIGPANQHLGQDVRHGLSKKGQTFPGVLA